MFVQIYTLCINPRKMIFNQCLEGEGATFCLSANHRKDYNHSCHELWYYWYRRWRTDLCQTVSDTGFCKSPETVWWLRLYDEKHKNLLISVTRTRVAGISHNTATVYVFKTFKQKHSLWNQRFIFLFETTGPYTDKYSSVSRGGLFANSIDNSSANNPMSILF